MRTNIIELYKTIGVISILPIIVYFILLIPSTIIFGFTWLLSPFQPEKFSDLELLNN
ncbi:MAG: hypothetical protein ACOYMA_21950 [Bacteroidia bacterium]